MTSFSSSRRARPRRLALSGVVGLSCAAFVASAAPAFAATSKTTTVAGLILSINAAKHTFTIEDQTSDDFSFTTTASTTFLPNGGKSGAFTFSDIKVGQDVVIDFLTTASSSTALSVSVVTQGPGTNGLIRVGSQYLPRGFPAVIPIPAKATILNEVGATVRGAAFSVEFAVTAAPQTLLNSYKVALVKKGFDIESSGTQVVGVSRIYINSDQPNAPYWTCDASIITKANDIDSTKDQLKPGQVEFTLYVSPD